MKSQGFMWLSEGGDLRSPAGRAGWFRDSEGAAMRIDDLDRTWREENREGLLRLIRQTERARGLVYFVFGALLTFVWWMHGDGVSDGLFAVLFLIGMLLAYLAMELLSVKALLFKAELREILRDERQRP